MLYCQSHRAAEHIGLASMLPLWHGLQLLLLCDKCLVYVHGIDNHDLVNQSQS